MGSRMQPPAATKRLATAGRLAAAVLGASLLLLSSESDFDSSSVRAVRSLSVALPGGECAIRPAVSPHRPIVPTFAASYPGSGAKMVWNLIEALTGLVTGDEHSLSGRKWSRVVTVKTHFPHKVVGNKYTDQAAKEHVPRAIMLIRNPKDAIPSYYSFIFEAEHDLPDHTIRAPLEQWTAWRDEHFDQELKRWHDHVIYWMDRYDGPDERLVVSYEDITDEIGGPVAAEELAVFLNGTEGVEAISPDSVPCVWDRVVRYEEQRQILPLQEEEPEGEEKEKEEGEGVLSATLWDPSSPHSHRSGSKFHPYTEGQLAKMLETVRCLQDCLEGKYHDSAVLYKILQSYVNTIEGEKTFVALESNR